MVRADNTGLILRSIPPHRVPRKATKRPPFIHEADSRLDVSTRAVWERASEESPRVNWLLFPAIRHEFPHNTAIAEVGRRKSARRRGRRRVLFSDAKNTRCASRDEISVDFPRESLIGDCMLAQFDVVASKPTLFTRVMRKKRKVRESRSFRNFVILCEDDAGARLNRSRANSVECNYTAHVWFFGRDSILRADKVRAADQRTLEREF